MTSDAVRIPSTLTLVMDPIEHLHLAPHPEGGYYREYYRGSGNVPTSNGERSTATAIHFHLPPFSRSHFHRLRSDELWFWQDGGIATAYLLHGYDSLTTHLIGPPMSDGMSYIVFPRETWFAAETADEGVLVSCVVAPGFDFADFELGRRSELLRAFPRHEDLIRRCTRAQDDGR
ncbi:MAG: cupin domain-containing protein [Candidatus Kapaibacterium sp.]